MSNFTKLLFTVCVVLFSFSGCGQNKPSGFPHLVPCDITITKSGTPLEDVMVIFSPVSSGGMEWTASGKTGANGVAFMTTSQGNYAAQGTPEGEYKAALTKPIDIEFSVSPQEAMNLSESRRAEVDAETRKRIAAARIIPERLEFVPTTPIRITISAAEKTYKIEIDDYAEAN